MNIFNTTNKKTTISRKQFLGVAGGLLATAALAKVASVAEIGQGLSGKKKVARASGNKSYGGTTN